MNDNNTFKIDKTNSDEQYLCVDVEGLGTVKIESPYKTKTWENKHKIEFLWVPSQNQ